MITTALSPGTSSRLGPSSLANGSKCVPVSVLMAAAVAWPVLAAGHQLTAEILLHACTPAATRSICFLLVLLDYIDPINIEGNAETAQVVNLIPWMDYEFRVLASNILGVGEPSLPSSKIRTKEAGTCRRAQRQRGESEVHIPMCWRGKAGWQHVLDPISHLLECS